VTEHEVRLAATHPTQLGKALVPAHMQVPSLCANLEARDIIKTCLLVPVALAVPEAHMQQQNGAM
jgi:hypothetical protein